MTYRQKLADRISATGSALCVGLDPRPENHGEGLGDFLRQVIEETAGLTAAYKPNIAYFEALGSGGIHLLEELFTWVPEGIPIILDCKRGDIGTTQEYYAKAYFERWNVDAVTLSPYLGYETLAPFLAHEDKGIYLLGVTSNPGAADIQRQTLADGRSVFELTAEMAGHSDQIGLVLGLTNASDHVFERIPDVPLLIPGLGAQGGDLSALAGGLRQAPSVINVSRGILYAEPEKTFAQKAEDYANRIAHVLGRGH